MPAITVVLDVEGLGPVLVEKIRQQLIDQMPEGQRFSVYADITTPFDEVAITTKRMMSKWKTVFQAVNTMQRVFSGDFEKPLPRIRRYESFSGKKCADLIDSKGDHICYLLHGEAPVHSAKDRLMERGFDVSWAEWNADGGFASFLHPLEEVTK